MNYYEHHLGDYSSATEHLSWDEDMAYSRLLRAYYRTERPIPAGQQHRVARAGTAAQRAAVDVVIAEFFVLHDDGAYHQARADAEIARYLDKQQKAQRSANARWSKSGRSAPAMRTHSEGNAHQTPDTNPLPEGKGGACAPDPLPWDDPGPEAAPAPLPPPPSRQRAPQCPDGVEAQVWADWLTLRKAKKAPVTATVLDGAVQEARKAGLSLDAFLRIWCTRGSQGLKAEWITPEESGRPAPASAGKPAWKAQAEAEAAVWMGACATQHSTAGRAAAAGFSNVIDMEAFNAPPALAVGGR